MKQLKQPKQLKQQIKRTTFVLAISPDMTPFSRWRHSDAYSERSDA